jgi:hypothetical protein
MSYSFHIPLAGISGTLEEIHARIMRNMPVSIAYLKMQQI